MHVSVRRYGYAIGLVLLSTFIFVRAISDARVLPPDCDETLTLVRATDPHFYPSLDDFINQGFHPLATYLSRLSVQTFGNSLLATRIPTLVVTALSLVLFGLFSWRYLSPVTAFLVLLNFSTNEVIGRYFHSNRGYALMLSLVFLAYAILWRSTLPGLKASTAEKVVFVLIFPLAAASHLMSGALLVLLGVSYVGWWWFHRAGLDIEQGRRVRQYLLLGLVGLLPVFILSILGFLNLWRLGEVLTIAPEKIQIHFYQLVKGPMGLFKDIWVWVLIACSLVLGFSDYLQRRLTGFDSLYAITLMLGFSLVLILLKMHTYGSRYFIAVPLFLMIWWGQSVSRLRPRLVGVAMLAIFFTVLVLAPARESNPMLVTNMCNEQYVHVPFVKRLFQ